MAVVRSHQRPFKVFVYIALTLICAAMLLPIAWMLVASLQGAGVPSSGFFPSPAELTLDAYREVFRTMPFGRWYLNSLVSATASMVIVLAMSIGSSYALARLPFRGKRFYAVSIVSLQLLPGVILAIPLYVLLANLGLLNTRHGLVITLVAHSLPFAVWLLWSYLRGVPPEIEEAALIDGANRWQVVVRIIVPLSLPGIVTVGLFSFVRSWEEYLYPLLITPSDDITTLTVGASRLTGSQSILWGQLMAYSTMMIIPMFVIFMFAQRYLLSGMTIGAVKG